MVKHGDGTIFLVAEVLNKNVGVELSENRQSTNKKWSDHQPDYGKLIPSGKRLHNYGKSPCLMGKSTISTGSFSIALLNYQRVNLNSELNRWNGDLVTQNGDLIGTDEQSLTKIQ